MPVQPQTMKPSLDHPLIGQDDITLVSNAVHCAMVGVFQSDIKTREELLNPVQNQPQYI